MKKLKYIEIRKKIQEIVFSNTSIVIGIGNPDRADDGAGILVVRHWRDTVSPAQKFRFFLDTESSIESAVFNHLDDLRINTFLFVDSTDFGGKAGEIVLLTEKEIEKIVLPLSTHKVPMDLFFKMIHAKRKKAFLLGIQPKSVALFGKVSPEVQTTLKILEGWI